jgi:hypothetical protein
VGMSEIAGRQGSRNKPIGGGASQAYAPGPDDEECWPKEMHKTCILLR